MSKGAATRQAMIEAAATAFEAQGYHGSGLNGLLDAAGAPRGSMYFHFPGGKEELAAAAVAAGAGVVDALIGELLASIEDPAEAVDHLVEVLSERLAESDFRKGCPVATVALETAAVSDRLHDACSTAYRNWQATLEQRLIDNGVDADTAADTAVTVLALIEGALLLSRAHRSTEPLDRVRRRIPALLRLPTPPGT